MSGKKCYPAATPDYRWDCLYEGFFMPRLSEKLISSLEPRPKDYFVWDDQVKGFGVRVKRSGVRSFIVRYRTRQGKSRRFTIGKHGTISTKDARKRALQLLSEILFGEDPNARAKEIREAYSFRELAEEFLARKKGEIILDEARRVLQRDVLPFLGNILAAEVTKRDVVELVDRIRDRGSPRLRRQQNLGRKEVSFVQLQL